MDKERMLKVAEVIEDYEDRFDMGLWMTDEWLANWDEDHPFISASSTEAPTVAEIVEHFDVNDCGSSACVAGWACFLWSSELQADDTFSTAGKRILGLSDRDVILFETGGDAQEVAERIRHWVENADDDGNFHSDESYSDSYDEAVAEDFGEV